MQGGEDVLVGGTNSSVVTTAAWRCSVSDGCHTGQLLWLVNHGGPECQAWDDCICAAEMPLVSKLAGLSSVGQYLQVAVAVISDTRWDTNWFNFLLLLSQYKTIWLSDHEWTIDKGILSVCEMKLHSRAPVSAPISSSLGSASCFSGATLALDITKLVLDPLHRKTTASYWRLWTHGADKVFGCTHQ